jgi:hypothetical protein
VQGSGVANELGVEMNHKNGMPSSGAVHILDELFIDDFVHPIALHSSQHGEVTAAAVAAASGRIVGLHSSSPVAQLTGFQNQRSTHPPP